MHDDVVSLHHLYLMHDARVCAIVARLLLCYILLPAEQDMPARARYIHPISCSTFRLLMRKQPAKYTTDESPDHEKLLQAGCSIRRRCSPWTMTMGHLLWKVELASPIAEDSNDHKDELKQEKAPHAGWHSCVLPGPMAERLCGITDHIPIRLVVKPRCRRCAFSAE